MKYLRYNVINLYIYNAIIILYSIIIIFYIILKINNYT